MKDKLLTDIRDLLLKNGVTDVSKSILQTITDPVIGTGFLEVLEYLPEQNLQKVYSYIEKNATILSTPELFNALDNNGLLDFDPYCLQIEDSKALVCAVNLFVSYKAGYFYVSTDIEGINIVSKSRNNVSCIIDRMELEISVDCFNAILATMLCTAPMCRNLRKYLLADGDEITKFLRYVLGKAKALPIYSVDSFKSKLHWMNLTQQHNNNVTLDNKYNISIGSDAISIETMTSFRTLTYVSFMCDNSKLSDLDSQIGTKSAYFAHALYLLVSDIYNTEFPYKLNTGTR